MDVDVDELCSSTVTSTPSIRPAMGLFRITLFVNVSVATRPESEMKYTLDFDEKTINPRHQYIFKIILYVEY